MRFSALLSFAFMAATSCLVLAAPMAYTSRNSSGAMSCLFLQALVLADSTTPDACGFAGIENRHHRRTLFDQDAALRDVQLRKLDASPKNLLIVAKKARQTDTASEEYRKALREATGESSVHYTGIMAAKAKHSAQPVIVKVRTRVGNVKNPLGPPGSKLTNALKIAGIGAAVVVGIDMIDKMARRHRGITNTDIKTLIGVANQDPSQFPGMYQTLQTSGATSAQLATFSQGVQQAMPTGPGSSFLIQGLPNYTGTNTLNSKRSLKDLD